MKLAEAVDHTKLLAREERFSGVDVGNGIVHDGDVVHQKNNTATALANAHRSV
jgi:hypothetical protein